MPFTPITPSANSINGNVNSNLGFKQIATVLSAIVGQATGETQITPTNTSEFISVAQTGLLAGYDPLLNAMNQVMSRTIFDIRPYSAKFTEIRWDQRKWGNHIRKIQFADTGLEDDNRMGQDVSGTWTPWQDGDAADMYAIKKPVVLQTNWYSSSQYAKHYTIFRDQLDTAFSGVDEFQRFLTGVASTVSDELEQSKEEFARSIVANYIGALYAQDVSQRDTGRVIHLAKEFCDEMGISYSGSTPRAEALDPANYDSFIKWMFARLAILSNLMTERSVLFQSRITPAGASAPLRLMKHTPYDRQRLYLFTDILKNIDTRVVSAAFHENYLKIGKHRTVTYWQSLQTRDTVSVYPACIDQAGVYSEPNTSGDPTVVNNILGILFDDESMGMSQGSTWSSVTPFNAKAGYSNTWYHLTLSGLNDLTQKGILLLLD